MPELGGGLGGVTQAQLAEQLSDYLPLSQRPLYPDAATPAASVPRPWEIDARDFGVVANGATDAASLTANTNALQSFVNYLQANHRAGVLPAGTIHISAAINFSCVPQWGLLGQGRGETTIMQHTDNVPVLNLGSDAASFMHGWRITDLTLTYANVQPAANTAANCLLFSQMGYNFRLESVQFQNGFYGISVAAGIACPWGAIWDDLMFGPLSGGAINEGPASAVGAPNNHWRRFTMDCTGMAGPVFNLIVGSNFRIDVLEFLKADQGPKLMEFRTAATVSIGSIKIEVSTWSASQDIFAFDQGNFVEIDEVRFVGSNPSVNALPAGSVLHLVKAGGAQFGRIRIGHIYADNFSSKTGTGQAYLLETVSQVPIEVGAIQAGSDWLLTNIGGAVTAEVVTVAAHANGHLSANKGDADYTVALGDPTIISYETALTAPRSVNLPATNGNLFNGLSYTVRSYGAVNGANTLAIKCNTVTLATISADKTAVTLTYRRNPANPQGGWIVTDAATLP